jgi:hypothetical protein
MQIDASLFHDAFSKTFDAHRSLASVRQGNTNLTITILDFMHHAAIYLKA